MDVTFATRPSPRVIESVSPLHEDFVAATHHAVVVLDGISVPQGMETGCEHGTQWYVQQLGTRLLQRITVIPPVPLSDALAEAISEVAAVHADTCDLSHPGTPAATVAVLRTTGFVEYLVLSDAVIALDTVYDGLNIIHDDRVEATAITKEQAAVTASLGSPERAEHRREMVAERQSARNTTGGYWVASTYPQAANYAVTGSHRPGRVRQAAILTDGAARLVSFGQTDWTGVFDILSQDGPDELITRVRDAELSDPQCLTWPRTKPFDDATAVYCRITNARTRV